MPCFVCAFVLLLIAAYSANLTVSFVRQYAITCDCNYSISPKGDVEGSVLFTWLNNLLVGAIQNKVVFDQCMYCGHNIMLSYQVSS